MKGSFARWGSLLCACLLLTGCASRESAPEIQVTLPPAQSRWAAPENDARQEYGQTVILYLPSLDGAQLLAVPQQVTLSAARHSARALSEALLSHPGTDITSPVGGTVALALSETHPVEVSGGTATVVLGAAALRLSHEQLFTVGQALANTICQFGDVQYVNVLISGVQPGLNLAATLPAGSFQPNTREDLSVLWARASAPLTAGRRSFPVTLYYPAAFGKGILCENRTLSISAQDIPGMALALLDALSAGPEALPNAPACPDFRAYLRETPTMGEAAGTRRLVLRFTEGLNGALIDAGITRSVMMAALTYTLTTFLPGIDGVEVRIGDEGISTLTPSGTYTGAGEMIRFEDGLMRRQDFSGFLLAECLLYFAGGDGKLSGVYRPVPYYEACSPRALVEQLMLGPQAFDSQTGLLPVFPEGIRPADLLGAAYEDQTALLNFSARVSGLCAGMAAEEEKTMIYAAVNTLCALPQVKRTAFFVAGEQPDTLGGSLYLPGDFLPNLDMIAP